MFNTQLKDYVKVYKNFYSPSFCEGVVNELKVVNWQKHSFYLPVIRSTISYPDDLQVSIDEVPSKTELDKRIWEVINNYIVKDMVCMKDWLSSWSGYSLSRFNKYEAGSKMKLHCDHIQTLFDGNRKGVPFLSVLGLLNNDFEGGEFKICGEVVDMSAGDVIVFPSSFLYPHEVTKVKSGERYSFVSWVW